MTEKVCFVICPIGEPGSAKRKRADDLFDFVVQPVVKERGYRAERADKLARPGNITTQIIEHLVDDDLVIADLTGHNPNVFYELAIRHVTKKPCIPMIAPGEEIPFDVKPERTLTIDHCDLRSVDEGKTLLGKYVDSLNDDDSLSHNPVSVAVASLKLRGSDNPNEEILNQILATVSNIQHGDLRLSSLTVGDLTVGNTVTVGGPIARSSSTTNKETKYLDSEQVARWLRMAPEDLVRLRERGDIRAFVDRGTWKFKREDVELFIVGNNLKIDPEV